MAGVVIAVAPLTATDNWFFFYDAASFTTTGKFVPADPKDKPAYLSETEVDCFKKDSFCLEADAEYYVGYPHITTTYFQVEKWDKNGIIATSDTGVCMSVLLQIVFAERSMSATHTMKQLEDKTKESCKFFGADKTQIDIFVVKGSPRWEKEHTFLPAKPEK